MLRTALLSFLMALMLPVAALADPDIWAREGWTTDFSKSTIDFDEVLSGGPPRDGIPSIDDPKFKPVSEETTLGDREPLILLKVGKDVRGYPLQILTWHEIVNDEVGGKPVAVTYCPLCNASIVFERTVDGDVLEFGTTGKLRNSDLIMYDRQTDSWWQQFTGEAIAGSMVGKALKLVPSRVISLADFKRMHPNAQILIPSNPEMRDYGRNPYAGYDTAATPFLYRGEMPDGISPMARVVVVRTEAEPIVVALDMVRKEAFEKDGYRIEWQEGVASALDRSRIADGRDVGSVKVTRNGADAVHDVTFAFVAHAFHPDVAIIKN